MMDLLKTSGGLSNVLKETHGSQEPDQRTPKHVTMISQKEKALGGISKNVQAPVEWINDFVISVVRIGVKVGCKLKK